MIVPGSSPTAARINYPGDVDVFRFEAISGQGYLLETLGVIDTYAQLIASDGATVLRVDDDSGEIRNARIEWIAPSSGTYYLEVRHYSSSEVGDYQVSVTAG